MRGVQTAGGTTLTRTIRPWALRLLIAGVAVAGFGLDQGTKALALARLDPAHPVPLVGSLLMLQLTANPGAAFSMGEGFTVGLTIVAIVAFVGVVGWLVPRVRHTGWAVGTGLLLAGILGNLTDRLIRPPAPFHGHVVDFLQLPYFAIINVADICITTAAVIIVSLVIIVQVSPSGFRAKGPKKAKGSRKAGHGTYTNEEQGA